MSRLDDIERLWLGDATRTVTNAPEDVRYLIRIARAAERCVKAWETLKGAEADQQECWDADQALRAALEGREP